jgi:chitin disaccharide deacetylase
MLKLIINADDFGYSRQVNEEVGSLMETGMATSATLMAGGQCFADAARRSIGFPQCSFGVHLTLTELAPLISVENFRSTGLLGADGRLLTGDKFRQVRPTAAVKEAVFNEWSRQVERVLDCGIKVSHFDSHHHVHTIPWLFRTLKRLQERFDVRKVRISLNWYYDRAKRPTIGLLLKKRLWNKALRHWRRTTVTDYFMPFEWFIHNMAEGKVPTSGVAELMVHPGHPHYIEETQLLRSDWRSRMPCAIDLISYHDL